MQCRARLASVCRRWRTVSTGTHAAVVWQQLSIDAGALVLPPIIYRGSLFRWCAARGCHIRDLQLPVAQMKPDESHSYVRKSAGCTGSHVS